MPVLKLSPHGPVDMLSKVAEVLVHKQVADHIEEEGIITKHQHGYRKNHSTTTALSFLCSTWEQALAEGKTVGCLLFDLNAAVDCVDGSILDKKTGSV